MLPPVDTPPAATTVLDVQHEVLPEFFSRAELAYRRRRLRLDGQAQPHRDHDLRARAADADRAPRPRSRPRARDPPRRRPRPLHARRRAEREAVPPLPGERLAAQEPRAALRGVRARPAPSGPSSASCSPAPGTTASRSRTASSRAATSPSTSSSTSTARAAALVFPSLYEGFGHPGASRRWPAVAPSPCSNVASLPEVCGDAAVYFDPLDPESHRRRGSTPRRSTASLPPGSGTGASAAERFTWDALRPRARRRSTRSCAAELTHAQPLELGVDEQLDELLEGRPSATSRAARAPSTGRRRGRGAPPSPRRSDSSMCTYSRQSSPTCSKAQLDELLDRVRDARSRSRSRRARPAGASATSRARSRPRSPSRAARRGRRARARPRARARSPPRRSRPCAGGSRAGAAATRGCRGSRRRRGGRSGAGTTGR